MVHHSYPSPVGMLGATLEGVGYIMDFCSAMFVRDASFCVRNRISVGVGLQKPEGRIQQNESPCSVQIFAESTGLPQERHFPVV